MSGQDHDDAAWIDRLPWGCAWLFVFPAAIAGVVVVCVFGNEVNSRLPHGFGLVGIVTTVCIVGLVVSLMVLPFESVATSPQTAVPTAETATDRVSAATRRGLAVPLAIGFGVAIVVVAVVIGRGGSHSRSTARVSTSSSVPRADTPSTRPGAGAATEGARSRPGTSAPTTAGTASIGPPWSVRQATLEFYDPTRASPARGTTPAHSGRALRTILRWPVAANGALAPGRLPLVVFAHGYDVSGTTYTVMLDALARAGMVVAAPEFPGESTAYTGPAVESDLANEPCDMEFVAASLEHHPPAALRRVLPGAALIVAGHSDGATAAAWAGFASTCSTVPVRGVVALSPDDVPMSGAFRFGTPPVLLAMTGTADVINPLAHTLALYQHVPGPAWLVTVDGGSHLGTFTTDRDLARVDAMIADFVFMVVNRDADARARFTRAAGGRIYIQSR